MNKHWMRGLFVLTVACSGSNDGEEADATNTSEEKCDARTDLTQGTIDGPECDEAFDIWGRSDSPNLGICTDYLFESTSATAGETCDTASRIGFCVEHDSRDPENIKLVHKYEDPDSTLDDCSVLELSSYQCLNNPLNTWCNIKHRE